MCNIIKFILLSLFENAKISFLYDGIVIAEMLKISRFACTWDEIKIIREKSIIDGGDNIFLSFLSSF